ncbi:cilia- and flagella- associated protein 210 [Halichoeres trimaculatus]|uniref:cilia- and flagella- associated protein 210 n=1 Tax=Halichoeres trimaculatus TaxID=147232 RepID=UPI003D9E0ADD
MASVVQHGRRRGSSRRADDANKMIQPPDLQKITVLSKAEWQRIQDEQNRVDKDESIREEARQREKLHMQSKEMVKTWSNTISGQRQKKLEAKKIREQVEEEKRKQIDKEEAEYREQKKKEVIEKAKTLMYYQKDRVKGFNRALLLTEVLKEREAQIELKQKIQSASKDVDKKFTDMAKTREDEAMRKEGEDALVKKLERKAVTEELENQIKENKLIKEQQKIEKKKDGEEIQRLQELYQQEERMREEKQEKQKRDLMHAHLEHLSNRDLIRAADAQKQEAEEKQRKLFLAAKQKMTKLRKGREKELFEEAQSHRKWIMDKLTVKLQEQIDSEEQRIAKAVAEQEEKKARQEWEEYEKKAKMLESIAAHREFMIQEKEQRDKTTEQITRERLQTIREADKIYSEKEKLKAQKIKDDEKKLKDFNAAQMAERRARDQQQRKDEYKFLAKNAELMAEEDSKFWEYSQQVINAAAEDQRNVFPLLKAARERCGGPGVFSGARPSYLVQDSTGAQMPKYTSGVTQEIKKLHEAADTEDAKRRLGFIW